MAFTAGELSNIANAALDFYVKGAAFSQVIQERPLYNALRSAQKTFSGGKGVISLPVKGVYTTTIMGYTHNDTVNYSNPANILRAGYNWKEIHGGISLTLTELKHDGISVVDSMNSAETSEHSDREMHALTNLLEDKLEDMSEGWARSFNAMLWKDGTQDTKEVPGIQSLILANPTTGTIGGINVGTSTWWRNRAATAAHAGAGGQGAITSNVANGGALCEFIHKEMRQLRRYRGRPNKALAGSDFLDALAREIRANGNYSDSGFATNGKTDIAVADIRYKDLRFEYDPTLDDLTLPKRCYIMDTSKIKLWTMEGEDMKQHTPARPATQYLLYRAMTWTGGLCAQQNNCNEVIDIA